MGCAVQAWDRAASRAWLESGETPCGVEAVAICSPPETHFEYLAAAVERGLHVFCEKPAVWPGGGGAGSFDELITALEAVLEKARRSSSVVHENTQWVYTLAAFGEIAGQVRPEEVRLFRCELSPSSGGAAEMLMECAAHANSLLLALGGAGARRVKAAHWPAGAGGDARLEIDFMCMGAGGQEIEASYRFARQAGQPRHAAYEINGRRVERRVDLEGYRIYLLHEGREMPVADPVESSVAAFVNKAAAGPDGRGPDPGILPNLRMSSALLKALPPEQELEHA